MRVERACGRVVMQNGLCHTGDQASLHFWLPVEAEMSYAGDVVNGLPTIRAGEENIHKDEFRHFRRELRGVGVGDHEADVNVARNQIGTNMRWRYQANA